MNIFDFIVDTHARHVANVRQARFNRLKLSAGKLTKLSFVQAMREASKGKLWLTIEKRHSSHAGLFMERGVGHDS